MPSSPETKTVVTPDGAIAEMELAAVVDMAIEVSDEGTTVVIAMVATDGSRRWETAAEIHEVDALIAALKKKRAIVLQRKYGHARGARRGKR